MPNVTGLSFDIKAIKQADEAVKKLVKNAETGIGKINKSWKDMTKDGLNHFIQRINVAQRAISKLSNARVNVQFSGQANDLKKLGDAATRAIPQVNRLITAMQQLSRLNINIVGTGGRGSATAMDAQKIKYLEDQIKLLEKQLKVQQQIGQAIGAQVQQTNRVRSGMNGLGDAARKVRQIAGTIFSVQALMGYGNQLLQIRGEFEMQHRSLQVLLQDIDKANELWNKTVDLAVKSPFRVKDLVTYTKQLAAYRVEADKLYETNKMLADVSSGLGVDMNRLILAFGQVKAANYLRGTELRQFSEAGVNMLEELSKRYTELEGRMVSVGDVFERVSKRMVSFADVEAVFRTITSEGGVFYRMQEKQAETTQGMMRNLRDSLDLMFNDIGITHDKAIKNALNVVKQLIDNWRKLIPAIKTAGVAMLTYFSVAAIGKIISVVKNLWAVITAHPFVAIGVALAAVVTYLYNAKKASDELNESLGRIDADLTKNLQESISLYQELSETIRDTTKSNEERDKALQNIKSTFDQILPQQYLEKETILEMADGYNAVTQSMMDYYNEKSRAQKRDKIESLYGEELYGTDIPELQKQYSKYVTDWFDEGEITQEQYIRLSAGINNAVLRAVEDVKSGKIANSAEKLEQEIRLNLAKFANIEAYKLPTTVAWTSTYQEQLFDVVETVRKYSSAMESIEGLPYETWEQMEASKMLDAEKEKVDKANAAFGKAASLLEQYTLVVGNSAKQIAEKKKKLLEDVKGIVTNLSKDESMKGYASLFENTVNELTNVANQGKYAFNSALQNIQQGFAERLPKVVESNVDAVTLTARQMVDNYKETLSKEAENLVPTNFQEAVEKAILEVQKSTGAIVDDFAKYVPKVGETVSQLRDRVLADIEGFTDRINKYDWSKSADISPNFPLSEDILTETEEGINKMRELIPQLKLFHQILGGKLKTDKNEDTLNERIKVIDQMNAKYKELNKTLSKSDALEGAFEAYKDAFATAYGREDVRQMSAEDFAKNVLNFPDEDAVITWLDNLAKTVKDKEDKFKVQMAKGKFEMDVKVRLKKEDDQQLLDDIQELFDRYDLSLELKKLNIPPDLAKSLFDVDYLDLEGLKKAVEDQKDAFVGKDMLDEYDDLMKKIGELSRKRQEDEAKEFINFLKKNLNEIQIIQDKGAYNIALADRLFGKGRITAEQYVSSIRQIVEDTNKEVAKVNLDKFKDSATYIKAMGNLAAYSRDELEGLISALQGQVGANAGNMGADEIRAYYEALERLVKQYDKIESPFQKGEINDLIEYLNLQKELNKEKEKEAALEQRKAEINNRLNLLQAQLKSLQERGDVLGATSIRRQIKSAVEELKGVDGQLVSVTSNISVISEKVANLGDGMIKSLVVAQKIVNEIANIANASTKMFNDIKSAADALGADTESGGWAKAGYAMEMVGGVSSELTSGLANLASGNFAGVLANVVGLVTKLISGFAKIHDQDYQDIIEAQAEEVERLGKAYERLEKATEEAYSIEQLQKANAELERNVELQIASYKAMIAAENAKKNTDTEQIEAWNEEIEALTQQWNELKQSLVEGVGGVTDYRSQTRAFVDSWVSAFKETGDGLSGLKENFREFFDNIIAEQAALRVTEKFLAPFYESLNTALGDLSLSVEESKNLREEADRIMPQLSEALELIWNQLGGSRAEGESGGLSTLQKGVQGVTEDTAQIIEAYLNSMRGYISEQVTYTKRLYEMFDRMSRGNTYGLNVRMIS